MKILRFGLVATLIFLAGSVSASIVTITVGDDDCFGTLQTSCGEGATYISNTPNDLSAPVDPAGTDMFGALGTSDFSFFVSLLGESVLSATVSVKTVGLDKADSTDGFTGARFLFNSSDLGVFASSGPLVVGTASFNIPFASLIDGGSNTFTLIPESGEDYAIDYVSLRLELGTPVQAVPEPGTFALLVLGLAGLNYSRRKR